MCARGLGLGPSSGSKWVLTHWTHAGDLGRGTSGPERKWALGTSGPRIKVASGRWAIRDLHPLEHAFFLNKLSIYIFGKLAPGLFKIV